MYLSATHINTGIEIEQCEILDLDLNEVGGLEDAIDERKRKVVIYSMSFDFRLRNAGYINYQIQAVFGSRLTED